MSASGSQPAAEDWTVQRILEWTTGFLKQKGVESPRLEAELLLAFARKCPRIRLYTDFTSPLSESEKSVMRELVQRRAKREPLAYLVGAREFYGRSFEVCSGVLIPRPETEVLVDVCLEKIPRDEVRQLLEVGFGSGCVGITIACQRRSCSVTATEISTPAMEIGSRNILRHDVADRVTVIEGDVLEPLLSSGRMFDGLVSNPPYICDEERAELAPEVALHEPSEALFAGADGLTVIRRIIEQSRQLLVPGAFIAMEVDPAQSASVSALLEVAGFESVAIRRDLNGQDRVIEAILSAGPG